MSATDNITKIVSTIKRGPKAGLTAAAIAERTGFKLNTVRGYLSNLVSSETLSIAGTLKSEGRGRPANIYKVA